MEHIEVVSGLNDAGLNHELKRWRENHPIARIIEQKFAVGGVCAVSIRYEQPEARKAVVVEAEDDTILGALFAVLRGVVFAATGIETKVVFPIEFEQNKDDKKAFSGRVVLGSNDNIQINGLEVRFELNRDNGSTWGEITLLNNSGKVYEFKNFPDTDRFYIVIDRYK